MGVNASCARAAGSPRHGVARYHGLGSAFAAVIQVMLSRLEVLENQFLVSQGIDRAIPNLRRAIKGFKDFIIPPIHRAVHEV